MEADRLSKKEDYKHSYQRNLFLFLFASALGIFIFFIPINGKTPFEILYKTLIIKPLGDNVPYVILLIVTYKFLAYMYGNYKADKDNYFFKKYSSQSKLQGITYFLALVFVVMAMTKRGIPFIYNEATVNYMIVEIFPFTLACLIIGGLALPLLTKYGLLDFIGTLLEPIMRPLLKLPGKAAIDTIASIVGAAVVGIYLTSELYHDNQYTDRESVSIASGFSLNSVGYCGFLIGYCGLTKYFGPMFLMYLVIAYIMGAIIVRIPPISRHSNKYENNDVQTEAMKNENVKFSKKQFKVGFDKAIAKADTADNMVKDLAYGAVNGLSVSAGIIPMMAVIGGIALSIYHFTSIIQFISLPLVPLVSLVGIPEAALAAEAIFLGGIELFMPSLIITAGTNAEAVRFFVVMVSLVQVLYITETMLPLISFGLPIKFWELLVIWVERTIIAIPLMALATHIFFMLV